MPEPLASCGIAAGALLGACFGGGALVLCCCPDASCACSGGRPRLSLSGEHTQRRHRRTDENEFYRLEERMHMPGQAPASRSSSQRGRQVDAAHSSRHRERTKSAPPGQGRAPSTCGPRRSVSVNSASRVPLPTNDHAALRGGALPAIYSTRRASR